MIRPFGGINEEAISATQRRFQLLGCRELTMRHQIEMDEGIIQNRRELMQVFVGFRPRYFTLRAKDITGGIRLIIVEDELQFLRHRWQFPFGSPARFPPSCAGVDSCFIRFLLRGLVDGTEEG